MVLKAFFVLPFPMSCIHIFWISNSKFLASKWLVQRGLQNVPNTKCSTEIMIQT